MKYVSQIDANKPRDGPTEGADQPTGGRTESEGKRRRREGGREAEIDAGKGKEGGRRRGAQEERCECDARAGARFHAAAATRQMERRAKNTNLRIVNTKPQLSNECNEVRLGLPLDHC